MPVPFLFANEIGAIKREYLDANFASLGSSNDIVGYAYLVVGGNWDLAFAAALSIGSVTVSGDGVYNVNAPINVPSNRVIAATGNATINYTGALPGAARGVFESTNGTDIEIRNLKFTAPVYDTLFCFVGKGVRGLWLDRLRPTGLQLFRTDTTAANYAAVNIDETSGGFNGCEGIIASRCRTSLGNRTSGEFAAHVRYTVDWTVYDCEFDLVGHGVVWWGGDSNPAVDGALANQRKNKRGTVTDCKVTRSVAGVWGSMGEGIDCKGNHVSDCTDVGLDAEGSRDITFEGGEILNCVNGNFATFWYNRGIKFIGISSRQDVNGSVHGRIYNASASAANNDDVTFAGCTFRNTVGQGTFDDNSGPVRSWILSSNQFENVKVSFVQNFNMGEIIGNSFEYTIDPGAAFTALDAHAGILIDRPAGALRLEHNEYAVRFAPANGTKCINVFSNDSNGNSFISIFRQIIRGFTGAGVFEIAITESGANGGISGVFQIDNNLLDGGLYSRTESGALRSKTQLRENRLATGAPFPTGTAPAGNWDAGQTSERFPFVAGAFMYDVATVSGSPGTWRTAAPIT